MGEVHWNLIKQCTPGHPNTMKKLLLLNFCQQFGKIHLSVRTADLATKFGHQFATCLRFHEQCNKIFKCTINKLDVQSPSTFRSPKKFGPAITRPICPAKIFPPSVQFFNWYFRQDCGWWHFRMAKYFQLKMFLAFGRQWMSPELV